MDILQINDHGSALSTIPLLIAAQCLYLLFAARRICPPTRSDAFWAAGILSAIWVVWAGISTALAFRGVYDRTEFPALFPGFLLPLWVVALTAAPAVLPAVRRGLYALALETPAHWHVGIQALRIAALGTLLKTHQGAFPVHVELAIGLNDLAYGLSAIPMFLLARAGKLSPDALALWHIVGMLVILIPGGLSIQAGLPGPWQVFGTPPTTEVMFDWPMVLAPSLAVPVFVLLNAFGAWSALLQARNRIASA